MTRHRAPTHASLAVWRARVRIVSSDYLPHDRSPSAPLNTAPGGNWFQWSAWYFGRRKRPRIPAFCCYTYITPSRPARARKAMKAPRGRGPCLAGIPVVGDRVIAAAAAITPAASAFERWRRTGDRRRTILDGGNSTPQALRASAMLGCHAKLGVPNICQPFGPCRVGCHSERVRKRRVGTRNGCCGHRLSADRPD
jgi:hypothetical protein